MPLTAHAKQTNDPAPAARRSRPWPPSRSRARWSAARPRPPSGAAPTARVQAAPAAAGQLVGTGSARRRRRPARPRPPVRLRPLPPAQSCASHGAGASGGPAGPARPRRWPRSSSPIPATAGWRARAGSWPPATAAHLDAAVHGPAALDQVDFIDASTAGRPAGRAAAHRRRRRQLDRAARAVPGRARLGPLRLARLGYAVAVAPVPSGRRLAGGASPRPSAARCCAPPTAARPGPRAGAPRNPQNACFANAADGYLGTPGHIWRTTDGGRTGRSR